MHVCVYVYMYGYMYGCMDGCMHARMDACICVCHVSCGLGRLTDGAVLLEHLLTADKHEAVLDPGEGGVPGGHGDGETGGVLRALRLTPRLATLHVHQLTCPHIELYMLNVYRIMACTNISILSSVKMLCTISCCFSL